MMTGMSMSDAEWKAAFEAGNTAGDGTPADSKRRDARKLRWYERQYGAGFVSGFWVGVVAGFPLAAGVAAVCKMFVTWLFS